jgi:hypothetical protein
MDWFVSNWDAIYTLLGVVVGGVIGLIGGKKK